MELILTMLVVFNVFVGPIIYHIRAKQKSAEHSKEINKATWYIYIKGSSELFSKKQLKMLQNQYTLQLCSLPGIV